MDGGVHQVHAAGGKIMPQLWHTGVARRPGDQPDPSVPGFGPSELKDDGRLVVKEMTKQDIADVIAAYAEGALDAQRLGFDGVEIHGAHGYLIDDFFWEETNRRTDEYGGALENGIRFGVEVVTAVRAAVGHNFPLSFRYSQWKVGRYDARIVHNLGELERLLLPLSNAGVDIFHVSTRRFWGPAFEGSSETLAGLTKKITGKAIITVGSVGAAGDLGATDTGAAPGPAIGASIDKLAHGLARGDFDLVAVGRALLSDPFWVNKLSENRLSEARPFDMSAIQTLVV
jgi:2,4-dienoyl-CoA reductase-like NADH-dependent reductase (Old Yellow Enzyme family)